MPSRTKRFYMADFLQTNDNSSRNFNQHLFTNCRMRYQVRSTPKIVSKAETEIDSLFFTQPSPSFPPSLMSSFLFKISVFFFFFLARLTTDWFFGQYYFSFRNAPKFTFTSFIFILLLYPHHVYLSSSSPTSFTNPPLHALLSLTPPPPPVTLSCYHHPHATTRSNMYIGGCGFWGTVGVCEKNWARRNYKT